MSALLNINRFLIINPDYDPHQPDSGVPKTLLDWRWMKKAIKMCSDIRKSTPGERERMYNTLDRLHKLVLAKGRPDSIEAFGVMVAKFCKVIDKPVPELKGWLTEKEIAEYLTIGS